jgi:hypothetical protein
MTGEANARASSIIRLKPSIGWIVPSIAGSDEEDSRKKRPDHPVERYRKKNWRISPSPTVLLYL